MPLNPPDVDFPLEMRALPWPHAVPPRNQEVADEVTLQRSIGGLGVRTESLKAFIVDVERRLLTRYFASGNTGNYSAAELARLAQEAAALPALISDTRDAAQQARDVIAAQQGTLIYYQGTTDEGFERLYALSTEQFKDTYVDLVVAGANVRLPVVGLVY